MESIITDLKSIQGRIEDLDDPTAPEDCRKLIGDAHYSIDECIDALRMLCPNPKQGG